MAASDLESVYSQLQQVASIDVYKKENIPDALHYKLNVRIGDLVIVTHLGHAVYVNNQTIDWTLNSIDS